MKFSTREDVAAPIESAFEMICDFERYERAAMRRGAEIRRVDGHEAPTVGAAWDARFTMRGKERSLRLEVTELDRPEAMEVTLESNGLKGEVTCELIALSPQRTRIIMGVDLRPQTLPARLLIQSMKLTKTSLDRKYKDRVATYFQEMEERYRDTA